MAPVRNFLLYPIILVLIYVLTKSKVLADRCFNCTTLLDIRCRDPFIPRTEFMVDCPRGRECQKMLYRGEVLRYCTPNDQPKPQESSLYEEICFEKLIKVTDTIPFLGQRTEEQVVQVCNCDEELCNGGKQQTDTSSGRLLTLVLVISLYYIWDY